MKQSKEDVMQDLRETILDLASDVVCHECSESKKAKKPLSERIDDHINHLSKVIDEKHSEIEKLQKGIVELTEVKDSVDSGILSDAIINVLDKAIV